MLQRSGYYDIRLRNTPFDSLFYFFRCDCYAFRPFIGPTSGHSDTNVSRESFAQGIRCGCNQSTAIMSSLAMGHASDKRTGVLSGGPHFSVLVATELYPLSTATNLLLSVISCDFYYSLHRVAGLKLFVL
jgi:hypothetical protein